MERHYANNGKPIAATALYPDGGSESIYCTPIGDFDRFMQPITLPKGTRLFPFNGESFMTIPTYADAETQNLGVKRK